MLRTNSSVRQPRVLVVDDHPMYRIVADGLLSKRGCTVRSAADGAEALAILQEESFDLILLDCSMPVIDGYETASLIRARETATRVPIVAVTAETSAESRRRCMESGMDDFVAKPLVAEEVDRVLARWVAPALANSETTLSTSRASTAIDRTLLDVMVESARAQSGEGEAAMHDLVRSLADEVGQILVLARAGDLSAAERLAHRVAGVAAQMGAPNLAERLRELQRLVRSNDHSLIENARAAIDGEIATVREELRRYFEENAAEARMHAPAPTTGKTVE